MYVRSIFITILLILFQVSVIRCILEGDETRIKYHPYQVSVHLQWEHICGGVIIDPTTILTAAHCVDGYQLWDVFSVRSGATFHDEGQEIVVHRIIQHELYKNEFKHNNDIAILKLSAPLNFGLTTRPIELTRPDQAIPPGTLCQVTGWGRYIDVDIDKMSLSLKVTNVNLIRQDECTKYFCVSDTMICATTLKCYVCGINCQQVYVGDSGGPLVCEVDGRKRLVGLVSFGSSCKQPSCPGVYTKISALYDWIKLNAK